MDERSALGGATFRRLEYVGVSAIIAYSVIAFALMPHWFPVTPHSDYVIELAGQSNMLGMGAGTGTLGSEHRSFPKNVDYVCISPFPECSECCTELHHGPERSLAKSLGEKHANLRFTLLKYAIGGSSLLDWPPTWSAQQAARTGHQKYGKLYCGLVDAVAQARQQG